MTKQNQPLSSFGIRASAFLRHWGVIGGSFVIVQASAVDAALDVLEGPGEHGDPVVGRLVVDTALVERRREQVQELPRGARRTDVDEEEPPVLGVEEDPPV